jgi:hypothetical protein
MRSDDFKINLLGARVTTTNMDSNNWRKCYLKSYQKGFGFASFDTMMTNGNGNGESFT